MIKVIEIPKIGGLYPSTDRETVARVIELFETEDGTLMVFYRTYEGHSDVPVEKFWRFFKNVQQN